MTFPRLISTIAIIACLMPVAASAQSGSDPGGHAGHGMTMQHQHMMQYRQSAPPEEAARPSPMAHVQAAGPMPSQPGQAAFATIQEIVALLEADPTTDWEKANIDALRDHLADMNAVTLEAEVRREPVEGGMKFYVTGKGAVRDSIRRMVKAHAATMNGGNWKFAAADIENGAALTVTVPARDEAKLQALGFFGVMTRGMHHQEHHLMIARGANPHH